MELGITVFVIIECRKTTWQYASGTFAGNHLHHLTKSAKSKVLELISEHRLNWKTTGELFSLSHTQTMIT